MTLAGWPYPRWIAHRGAGKLAPENTLAAFRLGAAYAYRMFECDVKLSADDVPFLLHDATLDRTTDGRNLAGEKPWTELQQLDAGSWHSRTYAGEPLPSLAAIAAFVRRNGLALNLEIKPTPGHEARTGGRVAEAAARHWHGDSVPPLLSSFHPDALRAVRDAAPHLPRALLLDTRRDGWIDEARDALGCVAVVVDHRLADEVLIGALRSAGLHALAYTVNDPADAARLRALGFDALITDAIDRFAPAASGGRE